MLINHKRRNGFLWFLNDLLIVYTLTFCAAGITGGVLVLAYILYAGELP